MSLIGNWLDLDYLECRSEAARVSDRFLQFSKVVLPERTLLLAQLKQIFPAVNAAVVTVIKVEFYGVVADELNVLDCDIFLPVCSTSCPGRARALQQKENARAKFSTETTGFRSA